MEPNQTGKTMYNPNQRTKEFLRDRSSWLLRGKNLGSRKLWRIPDLIKTVRSKESGGKEASCDGFIGSFPETTKGDDE